MESVVLQDDTLAYAERDSLTNACDLYLSYGELIVWVLNFLSWFLLKKNNSKIFCSILEWQKSSEIAHVALSFLVP